MSTEVIADSEEEARNVFNTKIKSIDHTIKPNISVQHINETSCLIEEKILEKFPNTNYSNYIAEILTDNNVINIPKYAFCNPLKIIICKSKTELKQKLSEIVEVDDCIDDLIIICDKLLIVGEETRDYFTFKTIVNL